MFPTVNSDFTGKLDEVAEYYERKGLCQGEECSQLRVQVSAAPIAALHSSCHSLAVPSWQGGCCFSVLFFYFYVLHRADLGCIYIYTTRTLHVHRWLGLDFRSTLGKLGVN